jgi:acyl carrier protein
MTNAELRALILESIGEIAPEADLATVDSSEDIREAFDLDSMDFINLVSALHRRTQVNVPEADYNQLYTLSSAVAYLKDALARLKVQDK